jgi:CheY-like chemotaxis protein
MVSTSTAARRILVVEDNLDAARSLYFLLLDMGQDVRFAINGYAALTIARKFRPDIIFLDIGLPDTDGYKLARQFRREPGMEAIRIIALTAYGSDADRARSQEAGCDQHIVKPMDPQFLYSLLGVSR